MTDHILADEKKDAFANYSDGDNSPSAFFVPVDSAGGVVVSAPN